MEEKSNEYYLALYKQRLRDCILDSEEIRLLLSSDGAPDKASGHIYDYLAADASSADLPPSICIEALPDKADYPFLHIHLYLYLSVPKTELALGASTHPALSEMEQRGYMGNRLDQLSDAIGRILNGSSRFGLTPLSPGEEYITLFTPNDSLYGKCMKYRTKINQVEINSHANY